MDIKRVGFAIATVCAAIFIYFLVSTAEFNTEYDKCPYCYGQSLCTPFEDEEISLDFSIYNYINFKNSYFGNYKNVKVVIKKLANNNELLEFDNKVCQENNVLDKCILGNIIDIRNYTQIIIDDMNDNVSLLKPFKVCSNEAAQKLFHYFRQMKPENISESKYLKNIWTSLQINVEPLILQLLKLEQNWPLPKYYGACGRVIVVENCGVSLLEMETLPWLDRAYLALQLLQSAKSFTFNHQHLRFYLTDVSPDNIVVNDSLTVRFVDLENIVVLYKNTTTNITHKSEVIYETSGFAFSQDDLCEHDVSDHNYYAVCRLLLSKSAPYPMMKNGLLHTPPIYITEEYQQLFELIEECFQAKNTNSRIETGDIIIKILTEILSKRNKL